jgi:putative ABC transport system permease protein
MEYLHHKNLGYNREQVLIIPTNRKREDGYELAKLYKTELLKHPEIESVTASVFSFAQTPWATLGFSDDKKSYHSVQYNEVDPDFLAAMQIKVMRGRWFSKANTSDYNNSIVVNEALVREFRLSDPIGQKFGKYSQRIIGVVRDFNFESLHTAVKPLILSLNEDTIFKQSPDISIESALQPRISVRLRSGSMVDNIKLLEQSWKKVAPNQEFEFHFLEESLAMAYKQEQKSSSIVRLASVLSIFIACIGLFGLATLTVSRRTQEIGIRKVLGATEMQIMRLLSKDFIGLVALAAIISFPIAWLAIHRWLSDFEYRVKIDMWIFVLAGFSAILIATLTIGYTSIKAGMSNPVESQRTD